MQVNWKCSKCGAYNKMSSPDKRSVVCNQCDAVYAVTGLHVNGTPFLRYMALTSKKDRK